MKGDSRYKRINHSTYNILLGTKRTKLNSARRRSVRRNPYGDFDRDGVINSYDCSPYNKNQQGLWSTIVGWFAPSTTTVTTVSAPTITGGASTGGYITGGSTDVYTPSQPVSSYTYTGSGGGGGYTTPVSTSTGTSSVTSQAIVPLVQPIEEERKKNILNLGNINLGTSNIGTGRSSRTDIVGRYTPVNWLSYNLKNRELQVNENKIIYSQDKTKYVNILGKSFPLVNKAEYYVKETSPETGEKLTRKATKEEEELYSNVNTYGWDVGREEYRRKTSYKDLILGGDAATAVRKGFSDVGYGYVNVAQKVAGVKGTEESKREAGDIVGDIWMTQFFSPAFNTGSYGEAFQELNPKKKIKSKNVLAQNRFGDLGKGLDAISQKSLYSSIEKNVASKSTLSSQLKYLESVRSKMSANSFKELSNALVNRGFLKGVMTVTKDGVTKIVPLFSTPINPVSIFSIPKPVKVSIPFSFNIAPRTGFGNLLSGLLVPKLKKKEGEGFVSASQIDILTGETTKTKTSTKTKEEEKTKEDTKTKKILGYEFASPTKTITFPIVTTITTTKTGTPHKPSPYIPKGIIYPFWFPRIEPARKGRTYSSRGYYYPKKKTTYAPSVAAYQLGITMPKKYNVKQKFTGLEIRPQYNKQPLITPSYLKRIKNMYSAKGMKKQDKKIRKQGRKAKGVSKKINKFLLGG